MCLSASGDLYWLPPGPSPVGALTGIWSSLWEKKEPFCPACRVWIVTTSAVILTGLTVSSLLDLVKALCLQQCPDEGASGASGCQPCPACARALCPASPGPSAGREGALARGTGESSAGLSSGCCSAPRQKARLNLHLDMLVFEQETFILLQGSTPVTLIFCTCWLKQKTSDGQGGCWRGCAVTESCIWTGIAYCGLVWFCSSRGFSFSDRILSRQYWGYTWTGWVCPAAPALHNEAVFCDNPWHSPRSHLPRAVGQSPVPALPSLRDRLCFLHVWHFSSSHGTSKTLPYLTGWLTLNLFIDSKGFFWISMIFYIQRITNMIADLA